MKRVLSWLLVLVMVFSMLPLAAFAEESTVWTTGGSYEAKAETMYVFEPTEAGVYSISAADGALFAICNAASGFPLESDLSTTSYTFKEVGPSIGITATADTTITIVRTGDAPADIEWEPVTNTQLPAKLTCISTDVETYDANTKVVNFASDALSLSAMLGNGNARVVHTDAEGNKEYIDYTAALNEYLGVCTASGTGLYCTWTAELDAYLSDLYAANTNWATFLGEEGIAALYSDVYAADAHTAGEPQYVTNDDGSHDAIVSCTVCANQMSKENVDLTIAEAIAMGSAMDQGASSALKYYVTGVVDSVENTIYGNMYIVDEDGKSLYIYGMYDAEGNKYEAMDPQPDEADTVTVFGVVNSYYGTPQLKNVTLIAHEAGEPEAEPEDAGVVTIKIADYAADNGWTNGTQYPTIEKNGITVTATGDKNTGKYYTSGTNWRIYQNESPSVTISADSTIATVKVTYTINNTGVLTHNGENVESAEVVTVNDTSITFSVGNTGTATNGQVRITAIEVVLGSTGSEEPSEPVPGESAENPIYLYATENPVTNDGLTYYAGYFGGMNLSVSGEGEFSVIYNGTTYAAVDGVATVEGLQANGRMPVVFAIDGEGDYNVVVTFPVGSQSNPEVISELFYTNTSVSLPEGDDGYYYQYTAEGDGTVLFYISEITEGVTADIVVYNMNTYQQKTLLEDGVDNYGLELTVDVSEGDLLQILVVVTPDESWNVAAADITWVGHYTAKPGTVANPFFIDDQNGDTTAVIEYTVSVPAGETVYLQGRVGNTTLDLTAENVAITIDGVELTAENSVYSYVVPAAADMWTPNLVAITNNGTADAEYSLTFTYAAGTQLNPAELQMNEDVISLPENNEGYYYQWTATEDGALTVSVSGDGWQYVINNYGPDKEDWSDDTYGTQHYSDEDPLVDSETIEVKQGDLVEISVYTYDPNMWWSTPAGTITVTASFEAAAVEGPCTHPGLVHMAAVEPGCHYTGNVEHWYCDACQMVWTNAALTEISNHNSVILPATNDGLLVHFGAMEPGCHFDGNIEYWMCYTCEQVWQNEALTQKTNIKNVVLPATGEGLVVHNEAVEPGCHDAGCVEHWICYTCEKVALDEAFTQQTNILSVRLPATGEGLVVHNEAVEPGCHYNGQVEHWICYTCEKVALDEAFTQLTNTKNVVLPYTNEPEAIHVEAKDPTCFEEGNVEYWYCDECGQVWTDEALTQLSNRMNVMLGVTHKNLVHMEAVEPGCHDNGNIEYWVCYDCGGHWLDELCRFNTNAMSVVLPATEEGNVAHMEAVEPGCHYDGNIEYWVCYDCEKVWTDEALTQLSNIKNVVVPATRDVDPVHVEAVAPTCYENGNIEYWYCEKCEQVWQDEALTQLSNRMNVVDPARHTLVHFDAVAPACHYEGNVEYWFCSVCEGFWTDELCTKVTNSKSVVLPEVGGDVVHVEAKEPSCANGNIEYWYCEKCEQVWQDEALTQLTNRMNVIRPATGIHDIDAEDLIWSWNEDKSEAVGFAYCSGCDETVVFNATVSGPRVVKATNETYKNIVTTYNYYTATVTYNGWTATNTCVVVDPTCRHVGFTSFFGDVLIGNTVHNFPEYTKDFVMGSAWGKYEVVKKLDHVWKEEGKVGDEDYIKYCVNCNLDYKNVATGDAIMVSVIMMILAGAAVVILLTKKRRMV